MSFTQTATIRKTAERAKFENLGVSESFLRSACSSGRLKHTKAGVKVMIFWPNLISFIENGDDTAAETITDNGKL